MKTPKLTYEVPTVGRRGMTALHHAAYCNDVEATRAELQSGAPVDVQDDNGWTPLHWSIDMASAWGDPESVVALLLASGASANATDHFGVSALTRACDTYNLTIFRMLLGAGADFRTEIGGSTLLHFAASINFSEGVRELLRLGADPFRKDAEGRTPEEIAEEQDFKETVAVFKAARS
jgi:ankyrin repeat protein